MVVLNNRQIVDTLFYAPPSTHKPTVRREFKVIIQELSSTCTRYHLYKCSQGLTRFCHVSQDGNVCRN